MEPKTVHVFTRNNKTGVVLHKTVENDDLLIEETIDGMLGKAGYLSSLWACYDGGKSIEECTEDFMKYVQCVLNARSAITMRT